MLFNLDWLKTGEYFPPRTELKRLKGYADNANLFDDEPARVLEPYYQRFKQIVGKLKDNADESDFFNYPNYWQLSTIKTVDLMVSDRPTIICEKAGDELKTVLQDTLFFNKLKELVIDNDSLGECVLRPYINKEGKRDFVAQSPSLWFPICNPENIKEIVTDCICWTVCVSQDANHPSKNKYELYVKMQNRGTNIVEIRRYAIPKVEDYTDYTDKLTLEHFGNWRFYNIGTLLETKTEETPFNQLVINIPGVTTSRTLHGISNYDRITATVAELAIRQCLASFILDQNSAPRMAAPDSAFVRNDDGKWVLKTGGRSFVVEPGGQVPVYVTWDGSLTANESRIKDLKQELYSLCEVGPVINQDELNSSQGYEALHVKLTNAKFKAARMSDNFSESLKKLIAFLLDRADIKDSDVNIIFNSGVPVSEMQTIATAQAKKNLGFSAHSIFMEYFGLTEEQAQVEVEKAREESASAFIEAFGINKNNDFNKGDGEEYDANKGGKVGENGDGGKSPDGKTNTAQNGGEGAKDGNKQ